MYKLGFLSSVWLFIVYKALGFKTKLSADRVAGFNVGTKGTSYDRESHDTMQFALTRKTLKNVPFNITLVVLVTAFF